MHSFVLSKIIKKSPQAIFFDEINPKSFLQHMDGIKKKPREKGFLQEEMVTSLVSQTKIAYGDFLKRPELASLYSGKLTIKIIGREDYLHGLIKVH